MYGTTHFFVPSLQRKWEVYTSFKLEILNADTVKGCWLPCQCIGKEHVHLILVFELICRMLQWVLKWNLLDSLSYMALRISGIILGCELCFDLADSSEIVIKMYAYEKHPLGSCSCKEDMRNELNAGHD